MMPHAAVSRLREMLLPELRSLLHYIQKQRVHIAHRSSLSPSSSSARDSQSPSPHHKSLFKSERHKLHKFSTSDSELSLQLSTVRWMLKDEAGLVFSLVFCPLLLRFQADKAQGGAAFQVVALSECSSFVSFTHASPAALSSTFSTLSNSGTLLGHSTEGRQGASSASGAALDLPLALSKLVAQISPALSSLLDRSNTVAATRDAMQRLATHLSEDCTTSVRSAAASSLSSEAAAEWSPQADAVYVALQLGTSLAPPKGLGASVCVSLALSRQRSVSTDRREAEPSHVGKRTRMQKEKEHNSTKGERAGDSPLVIVPLSKHKTDGADQTGAAGGSGKDAKKSRPLPCSQSQSKKRSRGEAQVEPLDEERNEEVVAEEEEEEQAKPAHTGDRDELEETDEAAEEREGSNAREGGSRTRRTGREGGEGRTRRAGDRPSVRSRKLQVEASEQQENEWAEEESHPSKRSKSEKKEEKRPSRSAQSAKRRKTEGEEGEDAALVAHKEEEKKEAYSLLGLELDSSALCTIAVDPDAWSDFVSEDP